MTDDAIRISTALTDEGFEQHLDIRGHITKKVVDVLAAQSDDAFRLKLVELGWTPPAGDEANALMLLLRAARQQGVDAAAQPWLPIADAPKDGTPVLVWDTADNVQTTAAWREDGMRHLDGTTGQWYLCSTDAYGERQIADATHFKPLGPNPPGHKS